MLLHLRLVGDFSLWKNLHINRRRNRTLPHTSVVTMFADFTPTSRSCHTAFAIPQTEHFYRIGQRLPGCGLDRKEVYKEVMADFPQKTPYFSSFTLITLYDD